MKVLLLAVFLLLGAIGLRAQEAELPPIVVTGTFELRPTPSVTDLFALYLQRQIETRHAAEKAVEQSPIFNARFWSYIPFRVESCASDSSQFFTPNYLSSDYRNAERALEDSRKQSLFDVK